MKMWILALSLGIFGLGSFATYVSTNVPAPTTQTHAASLTDSPSETSDLSEVPPEQTATAPTPIQKALKEIKNPSLSTQILADPDLSETVPLEVVTEIIDMEEQLSKKDQEMEDLKFELKSAKILRDQYLMTTKSLKNQVEKLNLIAQSNYDAADKYRDIAIQNKEIADANALIAEQNAQASEMASPRPSPSTRPPVMDETPRTGGTVEIEIRGNNAFGSDGSMYRVRTDSAGNIHVEP